MTSWIARSVALLAIAVVAAGCSKETTQKSARASTPIPAATLSSMASIGATKRQRIVYAARCYLSRMKHLPACRFDVVVVQSGELQWIKAAFGC